MDPDEIGIEANWFNGIPSKNSHNISIPHTWNIMDGYEEFYGTGWYQKEFNVDKSWIGKPVYLHFGAIYRDAIFWMNGKKIRTPKTLIND